MPNDTKNYIVTANYKDIKLERHLLPIFISFHPNRIIKLKLKNLKENQVQSLLNITKTWFDNLQIMSIEEISDNE